MHSTLKYNRQPFNEYPETKGYLISFSLFRLSKNIAVLHIFWCGIIISYIRRSILFCGTCIWQRWDPFFCWRKRDSGRRDTQGAQGSRLGTKFALEIHGNRIFWRLSTLSAFCRRDINVKRFGLDISPKKTMGLNWYEYIPAAILRMAALARWMNGERLALEYNLPFLCRYINRKGFLIRGPFLVLCLLRSLCICFYSLTLFLVKCWHDIYTNQPFDAEVRSYMCL